MARTPRPWFMADKQAYFVKLRGKRYNLGRDKAEAHRRFHELMAAPPAPPPAPKAAGGDAGRTVAEVLEKYLDWCQQHRSPRTYAWAKGHVQKFCDHIKTARTMPVGDLRPFHVVEFVDALPDLMNAAVAGPQLLGIGIKDTVMGNPTTKNPKIWQPFFGSEDVLHMLPETLQPHDAQTPAGAVANVVGQVIGGAAGTKGIQAAVPEAVAPRPTADDIRAKASAAYDSASQQGGVLKPHITDAFIDGANQALPQTNAGKLVLGENSTSKLVDRLQQLRGQPLSLAEAQEIDQGLGEAMSTAVDPRSGKLTADGKRLQDIQQSLRDSIENAGNADVIGGKAGFDSLSTARGLWAQSARLRDIEQIIGRAEMTDNPATTIKTGFRNLANNPSRMRGFSDDEADLIKQAGESGYATDLLRTLGSKLIPIGTLVGGGGLGHAAASEAMSVAARSGAAKLQVGKAEKVAEAIANRGIANKTPPSVQPAVPAGVMPGVAATSGSLGSELDAPPDQAPMAPISTQSPPVPAVVTPQESSDPVTAKFAQAESGGDPNAKNPNSSASGKFQFTDDTWTRAVQKWGPETGITLKDKNNPQAQEVMAKKLAVDNARVLMGSLGRDPTVGELYIAHFLGAPDATKLIRAQGTGRDAATVVPPKVVSANRSIFFAGKRPRTVEQVYQLLNSKVA